MFEVKTLPLNGALVLQGRNVLDARGEFHKTVHQGFFEEHRLEWRFAEQFYTVSRKDVVRGMHFQIPPHDHVKLVYCVSGRATDVLLDLRENSKTYGQCAAVSLSGGDGQLIYIPKGFAHGFRSLEDNTTIVYCVSTVHKSSADKGVAWNSIPYDWGIHSPLLSQRDCTFPSLKNIGSPFAGYE
jgi:dTDP-4-dehydrorhamnose 3,5-epimerase